MLIRVLDLSSETDGRGADSTFTFKNNDIVEPIEEGPVFLHRACHTVPHPACGGAHIPCTHKQPPTYTHRILTCSSVLVPTASLCRTPAQSIYPGTWNSKIQTSDIASLQSSAPNAML